MSPRHRQSHCPCSLVDPPHPNSTQEALPPHPTNTAAAAMRKSQTMGHLSGFFKKGKTEEKKEVEEEKEIEPQHVTESKPARPSKFIEEMDKETEEAASGGEEEELFGTKEPEIRWEIEKIEGGTEKERKKRNRGAYVYEP
ncbi:uncharacterized protein PAC_17214 [Phialocephala subalpina]|uniref:Uncharacterized protein n=1 Tax=Phialocephala subalpina TaxID=576137 RepID=A0A1L7XQN3_9HELO|nr:uncharacterized protein PAC_17214 [Phialocephala subalpina]